MYYTNDHSPYSHWESETEIKKSLYKIAFDDKNPLYGGVPLYADSGAVYVEHEDSHSLIIGSTGSKKTRLVGMPALQMYAISGESFIATDPKAELYKKTYHLLKERDYRIFVLNLREPLNSNAWNPLKIPYSQYRNGQKDKAKEFVIDMASCIAKCGMTREPFWENSAADLLAGLILVMFEYAKENEIHFKSLRALRAQALKNCDDDVTYIQKYFLKYLDKSSFLCTLLTGTAELNEQSRSCIVSEFDQAMRPFLCQDNLIDMLSGNDIDMSEIGKSKTAVFLIIPDENTLYNKLITVFVKQCYTELLREAEKHPNNMLPKRVNFLLDEFSNLPAITDFPAMITASRSRNIRFNLFIQNQYQLVERYGYHAETIKANCENWVFLHSRELSLLNNIVEMSGIKSNDEPLVSVSMLQRLDKGKGEAFVLHKRFYPYIANLLDIDEYPNILPEEKNIPYPENTCKANSFFDFQEYCCYMKYDENAESELASPFEDDNFDIAVNTVNAVKKIENEPTPKTPFELSEKGQGYGWYGLILPIINEIRIYNENHPENEISIEQIKQKYGTLRFYASGSPDYII